MAEFLEQASSFVSDRSLEFIATIFSLIYLILSLKQKISMWLFGLISSLLYLFVFYTAKFYADASLMLYYVFVSIYGWITWKKKKNSTGKKMQVSRTSNRLWLILLLLTIFVFSLYSFILLQTDSTVPYSDAATSALSITATWMLARKKIEHWMLWIIIDFFAAGLYFYKELWFTGFLYIIYGILAIVGLRQWLHDTEKTKNRLGV